MHFRNGLEYIAILIFGKPLLIMLPLEGLIWTYIMLFVKSFKSIIQGKSFLHLEKYRRNIC